MYPAMKLCRLVLLTGMLAAGACHPGPVINTGGNTVGGTIAGIVSTDGKVALPSRKVTAINTVTGEKFETTTGIQRRLHHEGAAGHLSTRGRGARGREDRQAAWRDAKCRIRIWTRSATS